MKFVVTNSEDSIQSGDADFCIFECSALLVFKAVRNDKVHYILAGTHSGSEDVGCILIGSADNAAFGGNQSKTGIEDWLLCSQSHAVNVNRQYEEKGRSILFWPMVDMEWFTDLAVNANTKDDWKEVFMDIFEDYLKSEKSTSYYRMSPDILYDTFEATNGGQT